MTDHNHATTIVSLYLGDHNAARAQGFAEGIEATVRWLKAEYTRLVITADADRREGRYRDGTEMLNRAIALALSVPAIRALTPPAQFGIQSDE
jgi:hypothetical protein